MAPLRLSTLLADQFRILTFRAPSSTLAEHRGAYLLFGFLTAWAAGIGRYWDHPNAAPGQYLGLGSVVYVPLLALLLFLICRPLAPKRLGYLTVVGFVALTSLPAVLYAIPVERFMSADAARSANAWFLGVVAAWRVGLLAAFLRRAAGLRGLVLFIGTVYPLIFVAAALAALNLEHAAFSIMAGIRRQTPYDASFHVVQAIATISCMASIPLTLVYCWLAGRARRAASLAESQRPAPPER